MDPSNAVETTSSPFRFVTPPVIGPVKGEVASQKKRLVNGLKLCEWL